MATILIVEDERQIAEHLVMYFKHADFNVIVLNTGEKVAETVKNESPDLVVLDIMLPVKDGITVCKEIRTFSDVPIMMLTALDADMDRIIGLEAGADDYVCKPFNAKELVLRAKAILKRFNVFVIDQKFSLNVNTHFLSYQGSEVKLTALEFALMQLLFGKPNRIFCRQQIMDLAYSEEKNITDRAVDCHVKNLRKKIKQLGIDEQVIGSVYGAGYQYIPLTN